MQAMLITTIFIFLLTMIVQGGEKQKTPPVNEPTSSFVILPASVAKRSHQKVWPELVLPITEFWTPTPSQVEKAEKALADRMAKMPSLNPPQGFHFQEYYTPKYYSRDRVTHIPDDVYDGNLVLLDYYRDHIQPYPFHLYAGVTVDGEKFLIIYFQIKPFDFSHPSFSDDFGLYYSLTTGKFSPTEMEDG